MNKEIKLYYNHSQVDNDKLIYVHKRENDFVFSLDEYKGFDRINNLEVVLNPAQVNDLIGRLQKYLETTNG